MGSGDQQNQVRSMSPGGAPIYTSPPRAAMAGGAAQRQMANAGVGAFPSTVAYQQNLGANTQDEPSALAAGIVALLARVLTPGVSPSGGARNPPQARSQDRNRLPPPLDPCRSPPLQRGSQSKCRRTSRSPSPSSWSPPSRCSRHLRRRRGPSPR